MVQLASLLVIAWLVNAMHKRTVDTIAGSLRDISATAAPAISTAVSQAVQGVLESVSGNYRAAWTATTTDHADNAPTATAAATSLPTDDNDGFGEWRDPTDDDPTFAQLYPTANEERVGVFEGGSSDLLQMIAAMPTPTGTDLAGEHYHG